jgi:protein SCO1/2
MKLRILGIAFLLLSVVSPGNSQMKSSGGIEINEKLGSPVAMDVVLKDENGGDITLRRLIDKPTILIFNYFRCPGICPVLINNVVDVVNRISLEPGKDYRLIAISFDPKDTPQLASEKKANYLNQMRRQFPPTAWHFLTGTAENTKKVADSAGFNFQLQNGMYAHPGAIILLTPSGVVSRYLYGTSFVPADVEIGIREAASGQVLPTVSKVLAFCYTYDPEGRKYVLSITRVAGTIVLLLAAVFVIFVLRGKSKSKSHADQ